MAGKKKNYFVRANSSQGLVNLLYSNVIGIKTGIILKGYFEIIKQELLSTIAKDLIQSDVNVECIHSCYEPDSLEGIIIREKGIGVFSDKIVNPSTLKMFTQTINVHMDLVLDESYSTVKQSLHDYQDQCMKLYDKAYEEFAKAIKIHDEWEKIYISHMHFDRANDYADDIISDLFKDVKQKENSIVRHRFFGGATYKGSLDYVMDLTKDFKARYFIKGRPGSGKSTFLRKIGKKAEALGYDVEVYHCGFDPNSLDMIIVEDLGFCVFDSTAPHEYFPSTEKDYVLDMYAVTIDPFTDETFKNELDEIISRYRVKVAKGTSYMQEGKSFDNKMNHELNQYIKENTLTKKILYVEHLITQK